MSEKSDKKRGRIDPIRRVRGMQDFLPARAAGLRRIARIAEDVARLYGFERVEIPILERASLYRRSLGLGSDVVMKEMYAFEDKNGDELCFCEGDAFCVGEVGVIEVVLYCFLLEECLCEAFLPKFVGDRHSVYVSKRGRDFSVRRKLTREMFM